MNMEAKHDHLERVTSQASSMADPKAYIAHAGVVLAQVRDALIKAESMHLAKRSAEIVQFRDRLLRLDGDHSKQVEELTALIDKLEAIRG